MISFKPVTERDAALLRQYYEHCNYELCEYAAGTKLMWQDYLHPQWAETAGCLVIINEIKGQIVFDYPVPGPEGDEDAALSAIERYCLDKEIPLRITVVPEEKTARLLTLYPCVHVSSIRSWRDYIYRREDLTLLAGGRYLGHRNHINKFHRRFPDAVFRSLGEDDGPAVEQFWKNYEAEFRKGNDAAAVNELACAKRMMKLAGNPWFLTGGFFDGEKLIALAMAEQCGETLVVHLQKALYSYVGLYPALLQAFVSAFGGGVRYVNQEDDAADKGLREAKLLYGPCCLAAKYSFEPQNGLLRHVDAIPTITTARLTLSALEERDIPRYNALVLDRERNRWWGYDDVGGLGGPVQERSFFEVAEQDFQNRLAANFAVRLNGDLIGEVILYNFDYRGGAELGCRIDKAFGGFGYGLEVCEAVADWGLYQVNLNRVWSKCYKENHASCRMISSFMRRVGEDDTFFYFEKLV